MALASQAKKYVYPSQTPGAMTGGLGPLPSQAAPGPGAQMVTPVPTVKPIAPAGNFGGTSFSPQMQEMISRSPGNIAAAESARADWFDRYGHGLGATPPPGSTAPVVPQPLSDMEQQRMIEMSREMQRNQLGSQAEALTSPESWSFAGMPPEFWKAEQAKQETTLRRKIAARRTQLEQQRQAGTIGAAEYDFAIKSLAAEESQGLAGIQSDLAMARMNQGEDAAMKRAGALTSLYGAIPTGTQSVQPVDEFRPIFASRGGGSALDQLTQLGGAVTDNPTWNWKPSIKQQFGV